MIGTELRYDVRKKKKTAGKTASDLRGIFERIVDTSIRAKAESIATEFAAIVD